MEINDQVKQLEEEGFIRQSDSPWKAPLLIVPKKVDASGTRKFRAVVDFRKLNNLTVGDAFPMPNITSILDQLGKAKYFTCLDMASGYHHGINGYRTFVYLDYIIVICSTLEDNLVQLKEVFTRLRKYKLQLQPPKCEFLRHYLGHVITEEGIKSDSSKVHCVANYPIPRNTKEVKSFLGLVGYYGKFIKDFSKKAKPPTTLFKQD